MVVILYPGLVGTNVKTFVNSFLFYRDLVVLNHFSLVFHFYTPWKRQKIEGFLTFPRGVEKGYWAKLGHILIKSKQKALKAQISY